ncbi:MAG: hypothetical protein J6R47_04460, partial [Acholeplasmatales bacterium]|nr:hypothetical protein [Acholeplasmatales bacterium]
MKNVGNYTIKYIVEGTENYDGDSVEISVIINKAKVDMPAADTTNFVYTGNAQTYSLATSDLYTITGTLTSTNVGTEIITVALNDKDNYEWSNATTAALTYTFEIKQAQAVITVDTTNVEITYGETHTPRKATTNFGKATSEIVGDAENVGTYRVTYTVEGTDNYAGATASYTVTIKQAQAVITVDTTNVEITYGETH